MASSVNAISATELTPKNMQIMKMVCSITRFPPLPTGHWSAVAQYSAPGQGARKVPRKTCKVRYIRVFLCI